jgi:hypothetical protein
LKWWLVPEIDDDDDNALDVPGMVGGRRRLEHRRGQTCPKSRNSTRKTGDTRKTDSNKGQSPIEYSI